jgi:hypothetical protein
MLEQIAIAAIHCDYEHAYRAFCNMVKPTWYMWLAACKSAKSFYKTDIEERAVAGLNPEML